MGMSSSSGSCSKKRVPVRKKTSSGMTIVEKQDCLVVPTSEVQEVVTQTVDVVNPGDILDNRSYVADTVNAKNTMSESSEIAKAIAAYSAYGSNITVTFYHALNADTLQRSFQSDFSETQDNVHYSYLRIKNFQMKLTESMQYSYETGETRSQLIGTAILYPYFCPNQGDLFIYQVDETHLGLFRIYEAPERMSIKASTVHQIKFILMSYLTPAQLQKLNDCVDDEKTFSLERYLNDEGALLTSGESTTLADAESALNTLLNYYCTEFYESNIYNTFIESECLYDPYIVEFITKVIPLDKMPGYPTQLVPDPVNWKRSFWYKLLDPSTVPNEVLISNCYKVLKEVNYRTVGINALANRCYIAVMKDGKHPYPPFRVPSVYDNNTPTLPMQVKLYFDEGKVRPAILIDLASKILSSSRRAQFYYIPIIIFLLKKLISAIENGSDVIYNEGINPDDAGDCMSGCLNCIYSCNPLTVEKKLCPGTLVCACHNKDEYIPDDGGSINDCGCCTCCEDIAESMLNS